MALFRMKPHYKKSGETLSYYGLRYLNEGRYYLAATSVGDYALFGGGAYNKDIVDTFDKSLTHRMATSLIQRRERMGATSVGNYGIFEGGSSQDTPVDRIDFYDTSLTRSFNNGYVAVDLAATSVGNYALFGGGMQGSAYGSIVNIVMAINASLVKSFISGLDWNTYMLAATSVGDYALFGGGYSYSSRVGGFTTDAVTYYNSSLTKGSCAGLVYPKNLPAATSVGDYALFGGGACESRYETYGISNKVDVYDKHLTKCNTILLGFAATNFAATTLNNFALFGGGYTQYGNSYSYVGFLSAFDKSLTLSSFTLSEARQNLAATSVGNYALFGGGQGSDTYSAKVDVYQVT